MNVLIAYPNSGKHWVRAVLGELKIPHKSSQQGNAHGPEINFPIEHIEKHLRTYPNKFDGWQVVVLHRDPKDTAVSSYWHLYARSHVKYDESISEFLRDPMHGIEKTVRFNLLMKSFKHNANFLYITYEQLHTEALTTMRNVIWHFNETRSDDEIKLALEHNSFNNMRQAESLNIKHTHPEAYKTRRGVVGGYKDYLSAEDIAYCDAILTKYDYYKVMGEV